MKLPRKCESTKISRCCGEIAKIAQVEYPGRYPRPCLEDARWDLLRSGFLCSSCVIFFVFVACIAHFSQSLCSVNATLSF